MAGKKQGKLLDEYSRNARLKPAFLVLLPAAILLAFCGVGRSVLLGIVLAPVSATAFTFLLAEFGRDFGRRRQEHLFEIWGGKPSTIKLRHSDGSINAYTLLRYHGCGAALLGKHMPTPSEEASAPEQADALYEAVGDILRERTRDRKQFPLVFQELMSYGFRRNLWGMKPFALSLVILTAALETLWLYGRFWMGETPSVTRMALLLSTMLIAFCWVFLVTPSWVRLAADAYAERLLAACEHMAHLRTDATTVTRRGAGSVGRKKQTANSAENNNAASQ